MLTAKEKAKFPGVASEGRKRKTQDRVLGFQSNCGRKVIYMIIELRIVVRTVVFTIRVKL
jgi:hypothetical protein